MPAFFTPTFTHLNGARAIRIESFPHSQTAGIGCRRNSSFVLSVGETFVKALPISIALGVVFAALT
jgi:hypothetical protein